MRTAERTRIVTGFVNYDGSRLSGGTTDWTVVREALGIYTVRFTPSFRSPPIPVVVANWNAGNAMATISSIGLGSITVRTWGGATASDLPFTFTATGPA